MSDEGENEILAAARAQAAVAKRAVPDRTKTWPIGAIGLGAAIGSAAVAAAVIYGRRRGRD